MILTLLPLLLVVPLQLLRTTARPVVRCGAARMLRNFDRCELIIFTRDAALDASTGAVRSGVRRLIGEAKEASTLVALLEPADRPIDENDPLRAFLDDAPCWRLSGSEPQVAEVTALRRTLCVDNPDGFGGSDGFGRAPGHPAKVRCDRNVSAGDGGSDRRGHAHRGHPAHRGRLGGRGARRRG